MLKGVVQLQQLLGFVKLYHFYETFPRSFYGIALLDLVVEEALSEDDD